MAATVNITIDQGSQFEYLFQLQGTSQMDLVNAHSYASMKREYTTNDTPIPFASTLVGTNVTISMLSTQTANLVAGTWVYDVILVNETNVVVRAVQGRVTVTPQVTTFP